MTWSTTALDDAPAGDADPQQLSINGMTRLCVTVTRRTDEAEDIASFELRAPDGGSLPPFDAGAHIDVHLGDDLIRQYSLCNAPDEHDRYLIAVLREPVSRGGSVAMHDGIVEGAQLWISPPRNLFPLVEDGPVLLLAGGIGVTPLLSMAEHMAVSGQLFAMHYCARSLARMAFRDRIAAASYADAVTLHFDNGPTTQRLDMPAILASAVPGTHLYVCGPTGFIDHVLGSARTAGWPESQLHVEYFGAAPIDAGNDGSFAVRLAQSDREFVVPADQSIVDVLKANGVTIPTSCRNGVCGTCITRVLEGECDHRDQFFTAEEHAAHDQFTPCCSRAKGPLLVLDL